MSLVTEEKEGSMAIVVLVWIQSVVNFIAFLVDLELILFHRWLIRHGFSTYEYTIYKRQLKEKIKELKQGNITKSELEAWKQYTIENGPEWKSKVIVSKSPNNADVSATEFFKDNETGLGQKS